jgi:hypothetical protein
MDYTARGICEEITSRMSDGMEKDEAIRSFCEDVGRVRLQKMWERFGFQWVRETVVDHIRNGSGPRPTLPKNWGTNRKAAARLEVGPLDMIVSLPSGRIVRAGDMTRDDLDERWRFHERLEETNRQKKKLWRSISLLVNEDETLDDAFDRLNTAQVDFLYREARMDAPDAAGLDTEAA